MTSIGGSLHLLLVGKLPRNQPQSMVRIENTARPTKSLGASAGSVFCNLTGSAEGVLIRAAASTPPLCASISRWEERDMRKILLVAAAVVMVLAAVTSALTWADPTKKAIAGLTPEQVRWFTPPYYKDGR